MHYLPAAICSFLVAVTNNYWWNRVWTFRGDRGHIAYQGLRFLVVSSFALVANLLVLQGLIGSASGRSRRRRWRSSSSTPLNFVGNKLWSFRTPGLI